MKWLAVTGTASVTVLISLSIQKNCVNFVVPILVYGLTHCIHTVLHYNNTQEKYHHL